MAIDTVRRFFAIDPLKQELDKYQGPVPEPLTSWSWVFVQPYDPLTKPEWGMKVETADGWYYRTSTEGWILWFADTSGKTIVVKEGSFFVDGDIAAILSFSN